MPGHGHGTSHLVTVWLYLSHLCASTNRPWLLLPGWGQLSPPRSAC